MTRCMGLAELAHTQSLNVTFDGMVKDLLTSSACQEMAQEYLATNSIQQEIIQEFAPALRCVPVGALRHSCCVTHVWLVETCLI